MPKIIKFPTNKNIKHRNKKKIEENPEIDFLSYIAVLIEYWRNIEDKQLGTQQRLIGLAMTILQALDANDKKLPQYSLIVQEGKNNKNISGQLEYLFPLVYESILTQTDENPKN